MLSVFHLAPVTLNYTKVFTKVFIKVSIIMHAVYLGTAYFHSTNMDSVAYFTELLHSVFRNLNTLCLNTSCICVSWFNITNIARVISKWCNSVDRLVSSKPLLNLTHTLLISIYIRIHFWHSIAWLVFALLMFTQFVLLTSVWASHRPGLCSIPYPFPCDPVPGLGVGIDYFYLSVAAPGFLPPFHVIAVNLFLGKNLVVAVSLKVQYEVYSWPYFCCKTFQINSCAA